MTTTSVAPVVDEEVGANPEGEAGAASTSSPDDYASTFLMALRVDDLGRARAVQTDGGQLGASDAGGCERKAVWTVTQQQPTDVPKKGKAQSGTYLHEGILRARQELMPHLLIEHEMHVTLPSGVKILVHPDEIDPAEPGVTDLKTTARIGEFRRTGPTTEHQMQRALYYLAALQNGILNTDQGVVRNIYVNPADLDDVHVSQAKFDMEWVHKADDWFQRVIYAVRNLEDGEPQAPYNFCRDFCPFFSRCRPPMPELNQPIANPDLADLVLLGHQVRKEKNDLVKLDKQITDELRGLSGRVGDVQIVSTVTNGQRSSTKVEYRQDKS